MKIEIEVEKLHRIVIAAVRATTQLLKVTPFDWSDEGTYRETLIADRVIAAICSEDDLVAPKKERRK